MRSYYISYTYCLCCISDARQQPGHYLEFADSQAPLITCIFQEPRTWEIPVYIKVGEVLIYAIICNRVSVVHTVGAQ